MVSETKTKSLAFLKKYLDPFDVNQFLPEEVASQGKGFYYNGKKYVHHTDLHPRETALKLLEFKEALMLCFIIFFFVVVMLIDWHATIKAVLALLTFLYFSDLLFNLFLIYRSYSKSPEIKVTDKEIEAIPDSDWPQYTIFCPLYKEWQVVDQFVTAMSRLEYPKDRLQILLLLEEDDTETIEQVKTFNLPHYVEVVVVPHSLPKTKPKACNYGLLKAKGKFSVIYDAEDVPESKQLKRAILAFAKASPNTVCIQAKLNFYNPHQNLLTRVFTMEYSLWFDLVLPGLQSINAPIPLGGTSNHFKTQDIIDLKGWDAFNVTEDCDLGIRLVKRGFRTAIMDSTTHEEANSDFPNWFGQRTRWIKGYLQTYLVHIRDPYAFTNTLKEPHILTFQLVVGGKILSMLINPLMWLITLSYFVFRPFLGNFIESFFPAIILYLGVFCLVVGNFLYFYYYMIGCAKRGYYELIKYGFLVPFYWLAMSAAAWVSIYKLITNPHQWFKTKHGLHLNSKKNIDQSQNTIGQNFVDSAITGIPAQPQL